MEVYVAIAIFHGLSHWCFRGEKRRGRDVVIRRHQKVGAGSQ